MDPIIAKFDMNGNFPCI